MLLILEIILTVLAWTKGKWGWYALLPGGIVILLANFITLAAGGVVPPGIIILDVLAVIALIIMTCVKRRPSPTANVTDVNAEISDETE